MFFIIKSDFDKTPKGKTTDVQKSYNILRTIKSTARLVDADYMVRIEDAETITVFVHSIGAASRLIEKLAANPNLKNTRYQLINASCFSSCYIVQFKTGLVTKNENLSLMQWQFCRFKTREPV